jgi:hypothetical protein
MAALLAGAVDADRHIPGAIPETAGTGPHDELPPSPHREAMWAHEIPSDVATEIYGTIECVLTDHLRTAVEYVEGASRATTEELRERFEDERKGR